MTTMHRSIWTVAILGLGAPLAAQCATSPLLTVLGSGDPKLTAAAPAVGMPFQFDVRGGVPGARAALLLGPSAAPVNLPQFAATMWPARPLTAPFTLDGNGAASLLGLQSAPASYCGADLVAQAIYLDPTATGGLAFTNGLRVRFGDGPLVWANTGEDKVTRDELRAATDPVSVTNSAWDTGSVRVFGARNEVVAFNLVLEAPVRAFTSVTVAFDRLVGPGGFEIRSRSATGNGVYDFRQRNIELFHVRYLQVKGLSRLSYEIYDERHVPARLQRPWTGGGVGTGTWFDRPDHDKFYPDIAVPMEAVPGFAIAQGENQSVWADIYIPRQAPAGRYTGAVSVRVAGVEVASVPVELEVLDFALPDEMTAKT